MAFTGYLFHLILIADRFFLRDTTVKRFILFAGLSLFVTWVSFSYADNWPQWRGPTNNGICKEKGIPTTWGVDKNVAWKLDLPGSGGSTPVVWGDKIFFTSASDKDLVLICVSTDGKLRWQRKLASSGRSFRRDEANDASASPSTDGKHVYAFVGTGDLACFDFDGNEIWKTNVQETFGRFRILHGMHSSPLLHEDRLYLTLLHSNGHWLIAFDKNTGKIDWKAERGTDARGESKECYTTPCLWQDGDQTYLVVLGCDYVTAHHLKDGSEAWRIGDLNPKENYSTAFRIIASPVAGENLLVVPTARGTVVVAVKPGDGKAVEQWRKQRGSPDVPSPLIHDGLVYLCRENGVLQVWDAKTGEEYYQKSLHRARYRASPVYADGNIYLTSRDGVFTVVKAGKKFEQVSVNQLPDQFSASIAIANGRMYLRGFDTLYAIEQK